MDFKTELNQRIQDEPVIASPATIQVYEKARILSQNQVSVLIWGESGTGKNQLAEYVQKNGFLADKPFVCVHCNAIPSELFASELFGYFPNAFTGASNKGKTGLLEMANHGTILFDEINELSPQNQTLLLHFLQNKTITPLGSLNPKKIQARIICISGKDLRKMIHDGSFRLDLYYRICVTSLYLPPLRERREEIPHLIRYFIQKYAVLYQSSTDCSTIPADKMTALMELDWMGNIREIENFAQKICLSENPEHTISDYISRWKNFHTKGIEAEEGISKSCSQTIFKPLKEALQDYERSYIQAAIDETDSLKDAAIRLGISLSSLCRKKAAYQIHRSHIHTK